MELRDIEIFLVLAEELHFGRAAQRLHVSQARVSQAIKKQERRIGAELFARTSRTVRLTEVGRQFRDDLQPVYAGLYESLERAQLAARGITAQLRVSLMPFNVADLHPYWKAFRARHPQWGLQIRQATFTDPFGQLRSGAMDVMIVWLPVEEPDFTVGPTLCTDPRVLAVAADHRLAARTPYRWSCSPSSHTPLPSACRTTGRTVTCPSPPHAAVRSSASPARPRTTPIS